MISRGFTAFSLNISGEPEPPPVIPVGPQGFDYLRIGGGGAMRIHHLNCGTMCPVGGRLIDGPGRGPGPARLVCHCLLIETDRHGLVLIDTGLGLRDVRTPEPRLSPMFRRMMRLPLREDETALRQIEALGFKAEDVRNIVLTHLDFDHAGGIEDFPQAVVHVHAPEARAAREDRRGFIARNRYRPMQWDDHNLWARYEADGEPWFGFGSVRDLTGLPPEILMIPLIGHTWGHCGIAIQQPDQWVLHAGDAYFYRGEMNPQRPHCTPGLRAYQRLMEVDRSARLHNQARLRNLVQERPDEVHIFCAHDAAEFERLHRRAETRETVGG
jgi:glyoxylase-like metal-dependent hydrolase (beta-lactamase superfamily II)